MHQKLYLWIFPQVTVIYQDTFLTRNVTNDNNLYFFNKLLQLHCMLLFTPNTVFVWQYEQALRFLRAADASLFHCASQIVVITSSFYFHKTLHQFVTFIHPMDSFHFSSICVILTVLLPPFIPSSAFPDQGRCYGLNTAQCVPLASRLTISPAKISSSQGSRGASLM